MMEPTIGRSFELSQSFLFSILAIVFVVFIVVSIILYYHWRAYSERSRVIVLIETIYLSGGFILFIGALITIGVM